MIKQGMLSQIGSDGDFMPANQTSYETNSEQASWALAAMNAAEAGFLTDDGSNSSWIMLAEKVFSEQVARWDTKACDGGLKDGILPFQTNYRTKGSFSNGLFMQLAARLATYTGNSSYNEWPEKVWKWSESTRLVDSNYSIYNMLDTESGCDINDLTMWTAEFGAYLSTAAIQYNSVSFAIVQSIKL
jgi:mannan endo-1,6-alpha-mannosidase